LKRGLQASGARTASVEPLVSRDLDLLNPLDDTRQPMRMVLPRTAAAAVEVIAAASAGPAALASLYS
jgi:hypothetical protein